MTTGTDLLPGTGVEIGDLIARITATLGVQPKIAVAEAVKLGDKWRRCWAWFPAYDGKCVNHNFAIDKYPRHWQSRASNHLGFSAELGTLTEPTYLQLEALATLAGYLDGDTSEALDLLRLAGGSRIAYEFGPVRHDD